MKNLLKNINIKHLLNKNIDQTNIFIKIYYFKLSKSKRSINELNLIKYSKYYY